MISLDRTDDFIGKTALHCRAEQGPKRKLVGIVINDEPMLPNEHPWPTNVDGKLAGSVRAACYSPRRQENIGIALLAVQYSGLGMELEIESDGGLKSGKIVPLPLVPPGTPIPKGGRRKL